MPTGIAEGRTGNNSKFKFGSTQFQRLWGNSIQRSNPRWNKNYRGTWRTSLEHPNSNLREKANSAYTRILWYFPFKGRPLTTTNLTELRVPLKTDAVPKFIKPYRVPHSQKTGINQQVGEMLANDLIEPSVSPWNATASLKEKWR